MFASVNSMGLLGLNAFPVTVEINTSRGTPAFDIVGLGDISVQESRQRITAALANSGITLKNTKITVNLSPANVKKSGSGFDLPVLVAVLAASEIVRADISGAVFIGEVSLGGDISPVNGVLSMIIEARKNGIKRAFVPEKNLREASVAEGIEIFGIKNVAQLVAVLGGAEKLKPAKQYIPQDEDYISELDFAEVKGQENIKQAIMVAAAGFHNMLMIGPPGSGKSMLAKRIAGVLPPMSFDDSIETTQIYSISGLLDAKTPLIVRRPYRPISHTATSVGVIGGGNGIPMPGEISLAHNGVLFLDEFPEFRRDVLEALRQPLEDKQIALTRSMGKITYPCKIMLIAAMNPCPCGNFGSGRPCSCTPSAVAKYLAKISQPVLDRIDIQAEVNSVGYEQMTAAQSGLSSAEMREKIMRAREIQHDRFKDLAIKFNSEIQPKSLPIFCRLDGQAEELMKSSFESLGLSARAYDRILKVARTVADLDGSEIILRKHLSRAMSYRSLDRKYWNGSKK